MNDDLISRKWLMECVEEGWIKFDTEKDKNKFVHLVRDTASSAQPEIIRCKDCKHVRKCRSEESANKFGQIYECASGVLVCPEPEDFCSHAERRTDG